MLTHKQTKMAQVLTVCLLALTLGCSKMTGSNSSTNGSTSITPPLGGGGTVNTAIVAGAGATVAGVGTVSCPTSASIVNKLQNTLGVSVASTSTNCGKAYAQLAANLPQTSDCTQANGFDTAQLLIYACCSDLTTGKTPAASSTYKVTLTGTVAANKTALVNAGLTMLNSYTGGVAGASNATTGITSALTTLVNAATVQNTSTIAFMNVCIAASSAGALLVSN